MTSSKKFILWGGWYGSRNVGDQLLLLSITDLIEKFLPGDHQYYALSDEAAWIDEYTSRESSCSITGVQSRQQLFRVIQLIRNCDLFIFGGGVPFFDQPRHVLVMFFLVFWLRLFRKPYMTWAVSSQQIESWYSRSIFRWVLNGADLITCRDEFTEKQFQDLTGKEARIHLVADSGFTLQFDSTNAKKILKCAGWNENDRPLAALTPRYLRMPDGESETHYRLGSSNAYLEELESYSAAVDFLWEEGFRPIFIPMNTVYPDDDLRAASDVIARAKHGHQALLVDEILRPRDVPGLYGLCQISYVSRVHGCISSFLAATPMMMYAFAAKHIGIMETIHREEYALPSGQASAGHTLERLGSLIKMRDEIKRALIRDKKELRAQAELSAALMLENFFR